MRISDDDNGRKKVRGGNNNNRVQSHPQKTKPKKPNTVFIKKELEHPTVNSSTVGDGQYVDIDKLKLLEEGKKIAEQRQAEGMVAKQDAIPDLKPPLVAIQPVDTQRLMDSLRKKVTTQTRIDGKTLLSASDLEICLKGSPMEGLGEQILASAKKYNIDPLFMIAVSGTESGMGKNPAHGTKYNVTGLRRAKGGYQQHDSIATSMDVFANTIDRFYVKKHKNTTDKISKGGFNGSSFWRNRTIQYWNECQRKILESYTQNAHFSLKM